jgi:hypothetical protein
MSNENAVKNLIRIDDKQNPTLFRALQLLVDDLYKVHEEIFPSKPLQDDSQTPGGVRLLGAPANFTGTAYPDNLRLDWDILDGAFRYAIRMGEVWETARPVIVTASDVANVDPVFLDLVYGTYNFLLRAANIAGAYGDTAQAVLVVPQIGAPSLELEGVVSTVLLRWTVPASIWRIDYYIIYKNGIEIGTISGTFKLIQEQIGGTYSYSVRAVDIVGNIGAESAVQTITLHDPSEFAFIGSIPAQYNGTYVRTQFTIIDGIPGILGPALVQTWEEHFQFFGFVSPQDQVDQGYPLYFQPSYLGDGTYEEVFDFGSVQKNIKIVVDYSKFQIYGSTNIFTTISYSDDNITYSTPVIAESVLATSFRYVKVLLTFTNIDDKSVVFVSNLHVVLSVTLTLDSGSAEALAADVGGTLVTYNKIFIGINSVTSTPAVSLQPLYAVCDEVTKDNFRVLVFDSSGNRHSAVVSWKARGII